MSRLKEALYTVANYYSNREFALDGTDYEGVENGVEQIKDLIRDLVDETFDKNDAKALEFWQKVEKL